MATNLQEPGSDVSLTSTVAGIIGDFQELVKQQLALFKAEVAADFRKTREASATLAAGVVALLFGSGLLCLMVVYLLGWLVPTMPLWVCYLIVGGAIFVLGGILTGVGWHQFHSFNPLPDQTVEALKENLEWKTKPN